MDVKVYKITNKINEKVYIGQTTRTLKKRLWDHISKANKGLQRKFHIAIAEFGKENFEIEELALVHSKEVADKLELDFITKFDSIKNGYNSYLQAAGSANRGTLNGMAGKNGSLNVTSRPIVVVYYDDTITEWESMSMFCDAKKECDIRNVQAVAAGRRATTNHYVIFYKEDFSEEKVIEKRLKSSFQRRITLLNKNGGLIKHFKNIEEASNHSKTHKQTVSRRIKKNIKNEDESYFVYDFKIFK